MRVIDSAATAVISARSGTLHGATITAPARRRPTTEGARHRRVPEYNGAARVVRINIVRKRRSGKYIARLMVNHSV